MAVTYFKEEVLIRYSGDKSLAEALQLMSNEGVTSIAVVDNALNVIGNISTADVKLLTRFVPSLYMKFKFFNI